MAQDKKLSTKHNQINKENTTIFIVVAVAAFITVFSLVSLKALVDKRSYQSRVITRKEAAKKQLETNVSAVQALEASYIEFASRSTNIIGGSSAGEGDRDGDNARIVLDALPSKYDFPALTSSLEKILSQNSAYQLESITGTDEEISQRDNTSSAEPVPMPFSVSVRGNDNAVKQLLNTLERSIRPVTVQRLSLSSSGAGVEVEVQAQTYYKPEKQLNIKKTEVQ